MNLLGGLLYILTESPMSDEDKRDSAIIRNALQKRSARSNAKLTANELATLNKYDISLEDRSVYLNNKYMTNVDNLLGNSRSWFSNKPIANPDADKINFADKFKKYPEREYAQGVNNAYTFKSAYAGVGEEDSTEDTFQQKERIVNNISSKYNQDYRQMKYAIDDKKSSDKELTNYDNDRANIEAQYQKDLERANDVRNNRLKHLDDNNKRAIDRRSAAYKTIDDIKNKYRK